jgi:hypothetical protein
MLKFSGDGVNMGAGHVASVFGNFRDFMKMTNGESGRLYFKGEEALTKVRGRAV